MEFKIETLGLTHLEFARQLHNDPDVLSMLTDPRIVSPAEQTAWFAALQKSQSSQRLVVLVEDKPVAVVRLDQIDYHNRSVCIGLDIHKNYRGKKLAKPIYEELFKDWFEAKNFHRIWLLVADYNERARKLYEDLGFTYEGSHRQGLFKNGIFCDYYLMGLLKPEYIEQRVPITTSI